MTRLQAVFYLTLCLAGFAGFSWLCFKIMTRVFKELGKKKDEYNN